MKCPDRYYRLGACGALMVAAALVLAGCSGNFAPTFPSPDGAAPPPPPRDIYGQVTDADDNPLEGVRVDTTDGSESWTDTADANGDYRLEDVTVGSRGVTFALAGYATEYAVVVVADEDVELNMVAQSPVAENPTECPVITVDGPVVDEDTGLATISGTVANADADTAVLIQNGNGSLIGVEPAVEPTAALGADSGTFSNVVVLLHGINEIQIMVANAVCTSTSDPVTINYRPGAEGEFYFRATLTWNTPTSDMDLHTWAPNGQHSAYYNRTINAGELDVDDVEGYGPENFTCRGLQPGRFRVGVNNYSLDQDGPTACVLRVVTGSLAANGVEQVFGPYTLRVGNMNGGYPVTGNTASWWRPVDIVVGNDGTVELDAADNEPLTAATGPTAAAVSYLK